jgi:hypothetical protein
MHGPKNVKQTVSLPFVFICPSTRMEKRDFRWKRFLEISSLEGLLKLLNKYIFILKIEPNEHVFVWRPAFICVLHRSLLSKLGQAFSFVRKWKWLKEYLCICVKQSIMNQIFTR